MEKYLSILKISLAILGGWFVIVLWFLLLNVAKSPLNQFLTDIGIVPLMTHNNSGGLISADHFLFIIQTAIVFASGGFVTAFFSKEQEIAACSLLGFFAVVTCIIWDSCYNCHVYYAIDLFIWFSSFLSIMLSALLVIRVRLINYILNRLTRGPQIPAAAQRQSRQPAGNTPNTKTGRPNSSKKAWQVK
ncbi:MAG: hypothetical protein JXA06_11945 [Bacteroidetes bacterium]|nr:hypothetical protein [Bacteroidota bacterium]